MVDNACASERSTCVEYLAAAGCLVVFVGVLGACGIAVVASLLYPSYIERLVWPADYIWSLNPFFNYWPAALAIGLILAGSTLIAAI